MLVPDMIPNTLIRPPACVRTESAVMPGTVSCLQQIPIPKSREFHCIPTDPPLTLRPFMKSQLQVYPTLWAALLLACTSAQGHDHEDHAPADLRAPALEMARAAQQFLAVLPREQQAKAQFDFTHPERENWHFVPRERQGLPFKELSPAAHHLAIALLASGLSHRGLMKATTIMSLEQVLRDLEQGSGPVRDPTLYYLTVFGPPGPTNTWGWRVEGHHLSINVTIVQGRLVNATPSFFGSNPAEVRQGPRQGLRVLAAEEDLGFALLRSLDPAQRTVAIIQTKAPADIITGAERQITPNAPTGLAFARLHPPQQQLLRRLVEEYVHRSRPEVAAADLARIETAGWPAVHFAWAGSQEPGEGHYYRVQGPTFLLEFDNTQNRANHIHTVWRDFKGDFGRDLLREHYQDAPHGHHPP